MVARAMGRHRHAAVDQVHLAQTLRSLGEGRGDRRELLMRFFDLLPRVADDAPAPGRVPRGRQRDDLHGAVLPAPPATTAPAAAVSALAPAAPPPPPPPPAPRVSRLPPPRRCDTPRRPPRRRSPAHSRSRPSEPDHP